MFYCDMCAEECGYPKTIVKSYGKCEICALEGNCNDRPSSKLPLPQEKSVRIYKRPNLTQGQKSLFGLITIKLEKNTPISFDEAKKIYLEKVCKNIRNGIPHWYNSWKRNEKDEMVGGYEPLNEWELNNRILMWLTSNIGSLVLKGYLKVIPAIELNLKNK